MDITIPIETLYPEMPKIIEYFNKQTASENNIGYKIIPKGYFTYRSMSDTGNFTFNIQERINFGIVSPAYPVFSTKLEKCNKKFLYELEKLKMSQ